MAASLSQMIANRLNALNSSGPKTEDGKRRASQNARTLGLSKVGVVPPQEMAEAIDERKRLWESDYRPEGPTQHWIFGRLVAESVRLDTCEARLLASRADRADRASESWDDDRAAEVALRASRLATRPDAIQPTLLQSKHGVRWLLERWDEVADCLAKWNGWTHANWHGMLDLLGVPLTSRDKTGPWDLDPDDHATAPGFALVAEARSSLLDRLNAFLLDRDARHRELAEAGLDGDDPASIRLLERYASDARRQIFRHNNALRALQAGRSPSGSLASPAGSVAVSSGLVASPADSVAAPAAEAASAASTTAARTAPDGPPGPRPVRSRPPRPASSSGSVAAPGGSNTAPSSSAPVASPASVPSSISASPTPLPATDRPSPSSSPSAPVISPSIADPIAAALASISPVVSDFSLSPTRGPNAAGTLVSETPCSPSPIRESAEGETGTSFPPIRETVATRTGDTRRATFPASSSPTRGPNAAGTLVSKTPCSPSPIRESVGSEKAPAASPIRGEVAALTDNARQAAFPAGSSPTRPAEGGQPVPANRRSSVTPPSSGSSPSSSPPSGVTNPGRSTTSLVRARFDARPPSSGNRRSRRAAAKARRS